MKVYLDYIFIINFLFDFILLLGVSLILKRNVRKIRLFLGSLFGGISFFIVFLNITSILFLFVKLFLAFIMIIITFSYKDIKYTINNYFFLIILSILLGGFLYIIDIESGYSHIGMLFFTDGKRLNIFLLIGLSIIMVFFYIIYMRKIKGANNTNYICNLVVEGTNLYLNGYLDTGNKLTYYGKPVVIINKDLIDVDMNLFIPYSTVSGTGIMKGFYCDSLDIKNIGIFKNVIVALSNDKFHLEGADIILNSKLKEAIYENNSIFKKIIKKKK